MLDATIAKLRLIFRFCFMKTQIFQQKHFTVLHPFNQSLNLFTNTIFSKGYRLPEQK